MRDEIETFSKHNIQPFGVNPASVESHQKYVAKFKFPFPLLVDAGRAIAADYGALKPLGAGIARSVVVVDMNGRVVVAERGAPGPAEVLAALGAS